MEWCSAASVVEDGKLAKRTLHGKTLVACRRRGWGGEAAIPRSDDDTDDGHCTGMQLQMSVYRIRM